MAENLKPPAEFDENPAWTEADFARALPFKEGFPAQYSAWKKRGLRATGKGYNARVEKLLREALADGRL